MSVSKDQTAANSNLAAGDGELDAGQLDKVAGGDPVVSQQMTTTNNNSKSAQKNADKVDGMIRS